MSKAILHPGAGNDEILVWARALVSGENTDLSILANISSLLYWSMHDVNWAGFYLVRGNDLYLGPFHGQPGCVFLPAGKGVCHAAVARRQTVVVPDVEAFPGHIACDSASRSEIVVPLVHLDSVVGVLDVDSPILNRFDEDDRLFLEGIVQLLMPALASSPSHGPIFLP